MSAAAPLPPLPAAWQALTDAEVAALVAPRAVSAALCLEATQRWFHFGYLAGAPAPDDPGVYLQAAAQATAGLLALLVDHGIAPVFLPLQVPLDRGPAYAALVLRRGVPALLEHPAFRALAARLRVRGYGPWPQFPAGFAAAEAALDDLQAPFARLAVRTAGNPGPRLFLTVQLNPADPAQYLHDHDPAQDLLDVAAELHARLGRPPRREEVIAAFYYLDPGETLPPLRLLLSGQWGDLVGQTAPPLLGGHEDLYFPIASLLSLDRPTLRAILYDWLYRRPHSAGLPPVDYATLPPAARAAAAAWYVQRRGAVLGLGAPHPPDGAWSPDLAGAPGGRGTSDEQ